MTEHNNYFPSGIWDGFYLYQSGPDSTRHEMYFYLDFSDGVVTGSGSDDVGGFTWNGSYNTETFVVKMTKYYQLHTVHYDGRADESGIYGRWEIKGDLSGGFHIWPRKGKEEEEAVEEVIEATISA
jgi:hypothetical protein